MNKKLLIIGGSNAAKVLSLITDADAWSMFQAVVVHDEDFDRACVQIRNNMPSSKQVIAVKLPVSK